MNLIKKYKIGSLDRRITFYSKSKVIDGAGDTTHTWALGATVWANVSNRLETENESAGKETTTQKTFFTVRKTDTTSAIDETQKIVFDSSDYLIISIFEDPNRRERFLKIAGEIIK